jgi:hypothetical protein
MPASRDDLTADRLGGTTHPLANRGRLIIPGPAAEEMNTVDADTDLGMIPEMDQGILGGGPAAAPAPLSPVWPTAV